MRDGAYIEVIAPDPTLPAPSHPRPFGIDDLCEPRVASWAAKESQLEVRIAASLAAGFDPGVPVPISRTTPTGERISWRLSVASRPGGDGLVPFLIDWGEAEHPAVSAAAGCVLVSLRAEHPNPEMVARDLAAIGAHLEVRQGPAPLLSVLLDTPRGRVELR